MSAELDKSPPEAPAKERYGLEVLAVLSVSFLLSAIYALLSLIRTEVTIKGGFSNAQVTVTGQSASAHEWLDFLDAFVDVLHGCAPPFLAIVLLLRTPGGPGFGIGLDRVRGREIAEGLGFTALIGIPGLALVYIGHKLGFNAQIVASNFPDVWYRLPILALQALQNGAAEEVVVLAYLLTRLRQMGWSNSRALGTESLLRGSYHLYQGFGAFIGNAVMGLIFGWWFQRTRRVWPLLIAHTLLDAISFIGYIYVKDHVSWI